jgi:hypothetical protein
MERKDGVNISVWRGRPQQVPANHFSPFAVHCPFRYNAWDGSSVGES